MAKQEQPRQEDPQKEATPPQPEKKDSTSLDSAYFSSVHKYFNERKNKTNEVWKEIDRKPDEGDLLYEQFLTEQQDNLSKMANPKRLEKMQPKDISFAVAELAGIMANSDPESRHVSYRYDAMPEERKNDEKYYLDAKKIFIESCKKMFPEIEAGLISSQLHIAIRKLKEVNLQGYGADHENYQIHDEEFLIGDIEKLLKENPKELLKRIDDVLYWVGNEMKGLAYRTFKDVYSVDEGNSDIKKIDEQEAHLAKVLEPLYKLQLIKDEVVKKLYGNSDITPSERKEIDKAKSSL